MDYEKDPKTAIVEGLSSALAEIASDREMKNLPDLNLTDEEEDKIRKEILWYVLDRFNLTWKE